MAVQGQALFGETPPRAPSRKPRRRPGGRWFPVLYAAKEGRETRPEGREQVRVGSRSGGSAIGRGVSRREPGQETSAPGPERILLGPPRHAPLASGGPRSPAPSTRPGRRPQPPTWWGRQRSESASRSPDPPRVSGAGPAQPSSAGPRPGPPDFLSRREGTLGGPALPAPAAPPGGCGWDAPRARGAARLGPPTPAPGPRGQSPRAPGPEPRPSPWLPASPGTVGSPGATPRPSRP